MAAPPRRWVFLAVVGAAVLLLAARAIAQVYVDYEWYEAAGALELWRARAAAGLVMRLLSGVAAGLFVFANLYAVRYSIVSVDLPRKVANLEIRERVSGRYLMVAVIVIAILLGGVLSLPQDDWTTFTTAFSNVPFNETDPYFNADLGFFVYWLPFEQTLYYWSLIALLIVTALVVFLYALTPSLRWDRGRLYISGYVRRHLTVLAGVVLLILAWSFRLDMYSVLTSGSGPDGAFGYVDHKVLIPGNLILSIATLGSALVVVWAGWTGQGRLAGAAILGIMVLALLTREVAPFIGEHIAEEQDPQRRELPYQSARAAYSRRAFLTDAVTRVDSTAAFSSLAVLSRNVAVWDAPAISRALELTTRADVGSLGWHGSPAGIVADVPERPPRAGSDTTRATFGLSRVLAWEVDDHGALVHAPPSRAGEDETQLVNAVVFPGARGYLIVSDSLRNIVGAPIESDGARLAHALSFQRLRWASSDLPRPHPTVVTRRDVRDRLHALMPFFVQGTAVTPIVLGDSLFWTMDLYAASSSYPLSRHVQAAGDERTYFQHAATAIVYAATGDCSIVPDTAAGPLAQTWIKRFPTLFVKWSVLPASLRAAVPPAIDGLRAQAEAFAEYGTRVDSDVPRRLVSIDGADSALAGVTPVFVVPGTGVTAVSLVLVDASDRVRGIVIGLGGGDHRTVWFESPHLGLKWAAVLDRLHLADTATTGGVRDATSARGAIRALPLGSTVVFAQPTYLWRTQGPPTLARVGLLMGDSVRAGTSLAQLAGAPPPPNLPAMSSATADIRARAAVLYSRMREALRRGDWTAFGQAFDELGKLLAGNAAR
ncbi:MAG TPA: UPF0182 family protein [Gemmatimonadaceae bacterium]|nr:UPF0182 family protein [Gemmatimonadaceae bacterium]